MRSRRSRALSPLVALMLVLSSASCASTSPHPPRITHAIDPSIPKCAGSAPVGCLTTPDCQYDEAKQCQMCVCSPAWQTNSQVQTAPFRAP